MGQHAFEHSYAPLRWTRRTSSSSCLLIFLNDLSPVGPPHVGWQRSQDGRVYSRLTEDTRVVDQDVDGTERLDGGVDDLGALGNGARSGRSLTSSCTAGSARNASAAPDGETHPS